MITIFGWISAGLFLSVLAKFFAKRLHINRLNAFFMKHHRTFTHALFAATAIHALPALLLSGIFSPLVLVSGLLGFFCIITASRSQKLQDGKKWLHHHRFFSASALLLVICHIILHVKH